MYGVVRSQECIVPLELFQVDLELVDFSNNKIELKNCWCAFSTMDNVPVLLGYKDVLERLIIQIQETNESILVQSKQISQ